MLVARSDTQRGRAPGFRWQAIARAEAMRGKRGTAGQRAHALPMQEPGQERLGNGDAPRPTQEPWRRYRSRGASGSSPGDVARMMQAFAERAAWHELLCTGETVRKARSKPLDELGVALARSLGGVGDRANAPARPSDDIGAMPLELQTRRRDSHADFHR